MSKFFRLNLADFVKGAIVAILTGLAVTPEFNFKQICLISFCSFCGYLSKNLFTNSKGEILKTE
jgi:hypothetical protein